MLKKTCTVSGLVVAAAAGAIISGSPVSAQTTHFTQTPTWGGGGGFGGGACCSFNRFSNRFRQFSGQRSFNANGTGLANRMWFWIRNRNNNVAIARNVQAQTGRQGEAQNQFENQWWRNRNRMRMPVVTRGAGG